MRGRVHVVGFTFDERFVLIPQGGLSIDEFYTLHPAEMFSAAAEKVRHLIPPHVITDEAWAARQAPHSRVVTIPTAGGAMRQWFHLMAATRPRFGRLVSPQRWRSALRIERTLHKDSGSTGGVVSRRSRVAALVWAAGTVAAGVWDEYSRGLSGADVEVDGNIFFWSEHGEFAALFSPLVGEDLVAVFEGAAAAVRGGQPMVGWVRDLGVLARHVVEKPITG